MRSDEVEITTAEGDVLVGRGRCAAHTTRGEVDHGVVESERGADVEIDARAPGAVGLDDDGTVADDEARASDIHGRRNIRGFDAESARAELLDLAQAGGGSDEGELGGAEDDRAVGDEAEDVVGDRVLDAAVDLERGADVGADDRAIRQSQQTGEGVDAGDALELAAEVDATLELRRITLEGDGVGELEAAGNLEGRAEGVVGRRDRDRASARGEGVIEADDAGIDRETTRPAGVSRGEDEFAGAVLGEGVREGREGERIRHRQGVATRHAERIAGRVEVDRAGGREGARHAESGGPSRAVGRDGDRVGEVAKGGVGIDVHATVLDEEGLPCPTERIHAVKGKDTAAEFGQREA